jgi:hypothetical protein
MPNYAFLEYAHLPCPNCGGRLHCGYEPEPCYITFQWGHCSSRQPLMTEYNYQIGDVIKWRSCPGAEVAAWVYFRDGSGNIGSPEIQHLIVADVGTDVSHLPTSCKHCGAEIAGAAIEIRQNKIVHTFAYLPGNIIDVEVTDYYLVDGDGLTPMPEWIYHSMPPAGC